MTDTRRYITWAEAEQMAADAVTDLPRQRDFRFIYGIPRGGTNAAQLVAAAYREARGPIRFAEDAIPEGDMMFEATQANTLIVDDIYDSGKTLEPFREKGYTCVVLVTKNIDPKKNFVYGRFERPADWIVFPWERGDEEHGPEDAVRRLLQFIGEDPDAPHLQETPRRFLSWLSEFRADQEPDFRNTKFEVMYSGMVTVRNIPFTSLCAHHLLPFSGKATVAYIPHILTVEEAPGKPQPTASVLGLSKLARIVQHHAARLQSQEEMTRQICLAIRTAAETKDVAVIVSAEHSCMNFRGPRVPGAETITSEVSGAFWTKPEARAEFMSFAHASA